MMMKMMTILTVLVILTAVTGCVTTAPSTDFRLDFLAAVQTDCAIDKVAVNKDKIQIKCQPIPQEEF